MVNSEPPTYDWTGVIDDEDYGDAVTEPRPGVDPATSTAELMLTASEEHTQHWEQRALAAEAEVDRLRADLAAFHDECDKVGIPHDADGLVRHHRGNAGVAGAAAAMAKDAAEIRRLRGEVGAESERLTIDRLAEAIAATYRPSQHGQHCPIWVDRGTDPWIRRCDCWILERAQKAAGIALDNTMSPIAALSAGGTD